MVSRDQHPTHLSHIGHKTMAGQLTRAVRHGIRHEGMDFEDSQDVHQGRKLEQYQGQRIPFMHFGM